MKFDILTLFPGMFSGPFDESIIRRAQDKKLIDIQLHNIRDYAVDKHQTADDAPYGGGAGMVMKVEPLAACIQAIRQAACREAHTGTDRESCQGTSVRVPDVRKLPPSGDSFHLPHGLSQGTQERPLRRSEQRLVLC